MTTELLLLSAVMAVAAGLVGSFAVMRRMALAGDALAHIALPGIGVALALQLNPLVGALSMLFLGALLVWSLEHATGIATETLVGVVFSAALASGVMLTSDERLIDALLGHSGALSPGEAVFGAVAAVVVIAFIVVRKHALVLALVSPDIARTAGVNVRLLNFLYLEMFALTVALGLRYLGVLLMGSLIIIPAATARRLSRSLNGMLVIAASVALVSTLLGSGLARWLDREPGPVVVSVAAVGFMLAYAVAPLRGARVRT
jgi:ABC-type Mn2+/Zn2+ transport system permease subunit